MPPPTACAAYQTNPSSKPRMGISYMTQLRCALSPPEPLPSPRATAWPRAPPCLGCTAHRLPVPVCCDALQDNRAHTGLRTRVSVVIMPMTRAISTHQKSRQSPPPSSMNGAGEHCSSIQQCDCLRCHLSCACLTGLWVQERLYARRSIGACSVSSRSSSFSAVAAAAAADQEMLG